MHSTPRTLREFVTDEMDGDDDAITPEGMAMVRAKGAAAIAERALHNDGGDHEN